MLFGLTAIWFAAPCLLYITWIFTLGSSRSTTSSGQFIDSLPWVGAAFVLSLMVAGLLRWSIVGWRALTLSFAAAVIGSGVATIAHTLSV